jgi:polar amino acid transport system substrate-binding protein
MSLIKAGCLTFCIDVGYPPMEFYADGVATGADIEIAHEVARSLDCEARFVDEPVEGIIDALYDGRGDLIINAFTDSVDRRQRLTFVDYLSVGQTAVVAAGNPLGIKSSRALAGRRVAVQSDTSNERSLRLLDAGNQREGLAPMWIGAFKGTTAETTDRARQALRNGDADADFLDVIGANWNIERHGDAELAPFVINEEPYGIGLRKEDVELQSRVLEAIRDMYGNGTMLRILEAWKLTDLALDQSQVALHV